MSDRILVTGATGIVGSELVGLLVDEGVEVKAGTRNPARARDLFDPEVEVVELDYRQPATFDAAVEWADRVFLQPPPFSSDAYDTLAPLLDWAVQAGTEHVVALSAMGMEVRGDLPIRRLEKHVASLGVDYTFLRPNLLMQNFQRDFSASASRDRCVRHAGRRRRGEHGRRAGCRGGCRGGAHGVRAHGPGLYADGTGGADAP